MSKRAEGALIGLALGDALGMPTQMLDRARVTELYGVLDRFHPGPAENPISPGQVAGTVTDDTEQSVILARLLLEQPELSGGLALFIGFGAGLVFSAQVVVLP